MKIADIKLTHPDKKIFLQSNLTKVDIARYYQKIAPYLLPLIKDHPLTLKNYPNSIEEEGFFRKHIHESFMEVIPHFNMPAITKNESVEMALTTEAKHLVYLVNQDLVELHMNLSSIKNPAKPNQMIFDLDANPENDFNKLKKVALIFKDFLDSNKVASFVKTTGSKGLHIHIPFKPHLEFKDIKPLAKKIADTVASIHKDIATTAHRKDQRKDKIFIDYLRNDYNMIAVAPYSLRALAGAPVATPVHWKELEKNALDSVASKSYHLKNIFLRLSHIDDPWQDFLEYQQKNLPDFEF